jgi:TP901 family phage tail tape measure protein
MADVNASLGVSLDTSEALSQLKDLQRRISQFHSSIATTSDAAATAQKKLQANFVNSINAIGGFAAELRTVRTTAENFTNSLEKNKFSMGEYFRYAAGSTKTFGRLFESEMQTVEKTAIERVKTIQTQYVKLGRDASGAMQSIAIRPTVLNMQDLGTQTQIAAQKQALFNQLVNQGSTNLLNFGKNTQWAGRQLMVGFTLPLITLGTAAAKTFMDMEAQVIKFRKVYGDLFTPTAERDAALEQVKELASSFTQYGVAVSETIGLAAEAAAAGFSGVDLQNQTNAATKLSILGQLEQQKALETTISLQNAFQMSSANLATTIDFLNAVENQTVVSLDDITTAIPKVAPVIQSLGGDVKDLAFFLAAMKEGGVNASEGANALKSGLASLINPTEKSAEFLSKLGINIRAIVSGNEGDLKGTILEFATALDALKPLERAQAIEQMFGKFQFARLSTLFDNVIRDGNQASRVLDLASASIEDLASMSEQELGMTAESAMNKFLKTVENLKAALAPVGEVFLQVVTPFLDGLAKIVDSFNKMPEDFKKIITTIVALVGGLGPVVLMTFGLLANGIANGIKFINLLRNGFLRLTGQSQVLGESTEYLTNEQLQAAAAAASLDQAHQKLTQRFTVEASVVARLREEYEKALIAGNRFASINPGMMKPGAPKKFSTGGFVSGSGTGDVIPAMLTPGEFVIKKSVAQKALPFLEMLNAGQIPGFSRGGEVPGGDKLVRLFAEFGLRLQPGSENMARQAGRVEDPSQVLSVLASRIGEARGIVPSQSRVNAGDFDDIYKQYEGITEKFVNNLNTSFDTTFKDVKDSNERFAKSWTAAGRLVETEVSSIKSDVDKGVVRKTFGLDPDFYGTMPTAPRREGGTNLERARKSAFDPKQTGVRSYLTVGRGAKALFERQTGQSAADMQMGHVLPPIMESAQKIVNDPKATNAAKKAGELIGIKVTAAATDGIKQSTQQASPSKKAFEAGRNIGLGAIQGIESVEKRPPRRAGTGGQTSVFDQRSQSYMLADKFAKQEVSRQTAIARVTGLALGKMEDLSGKAMGLSFALSSAAGIASMFGGQVGEAASIIFGLSNALFGLSTVTQLLTKTKMAERAVSALAGARGIGGLAEGGVRGARGVAKGLPAAAGAGGKLVNVFRGLGEVAKFALGGFSRLIPVIGIAVTAFGAFQFFSNMAEEQRKKIEGLGETARLTSEQLQGLADRFGVTLRQSGIAGRFEQTARGTTAEQQSEAVKLSQDADFLSQYATQISAIEKAGKESAESVLKALALQLSSAGFDEVAVQTILLGITDAAKRTDLNLEFANIKFDSAEGKAQIDKIVKEQAGLFNKAFEKGFETDEQRKKRFGGPRERLVSEELQAQAKVTAASFANVFESLDIGLQSGTLSADEFNEKLNLASGTLSQMSDEALALVLPDIAEKLGIKDQLKDIKDYATQILLIKAATAGVNVESFLGAIEQGEKPGASARQQAAAGRARAQITKLTSKAAEATVRLAEANRKATKAAQEKVAAEQAPGKIQEQIDALRDQKAAYDNLVLSGIPAAEAVRLLGNESIVAAAKSGTLTGETLQLVKDLIAAQNEVDAITNKGGAGSQKEKTAIEEATESLREQRAEIINSSKAYAQLRKAGMDVADAFKIAEDPILAAALASKKAGSKEWRELYNQIKQTDNLIKRSELKKLLTERKIDLQLQREFSKIAPELAKAGFELEDIRDIMSDPVMAQEFIDQFAKAGNKAKFINDQLRAIQQRRAIEVRINLTTVQGAADVANEIASNARRGLEAQAAAIRRGFDQGTAEGSGAGLTAAKKAVEDLNEELEKVNKEISDVQDKISDKQREIELNFDRPIEGLSREISKLERDLQIEIERPIKAFQEEISDLQRDIELQFDRPIAELQEESSDLANDLTLIDRAADQINKKYDLQAKALEQVAKVNQQIISQQKSQISLADALSQGDISAAAQIMQDMRSQSAQASAGSMQDALQSARESEISGLRSASGMTREQIEQRQFEIGQKTYQLEEAREKVQARIQIIQDKIYDLEEKREDVQARIQDIQDKIYDLEQKRVVELDKIRVLEDQIVGIINRQNDGQKALNDKIIAAEKEVKRIEAALILALKPVQDQLDKWEDIEIEIGKATTAGYNYAAMLERVKAIIASMPALPQSDGIPPGTSGGGNDNANNGQGNTPQTVTQKKIAELNRRIATTRWRVQNENLTAAQKKDLMDLNVKRIAEVKRLKGVPDMVGMLRPGTTSQIIDVPGFAKGGMVGGYARGGLIPRPMLSDTVPAMLTPGEFVVNRKASKKFGPLLSAINSGSGGLRMPSFANSGNLKAPTYNTNVSSYNAVPISNNVVNAPTSSVQNVTPVYNYNLSVNVSGSDVDANTIANTVMSRIQRNESQRIRRQVAR